jgi:hypothetical protein
MCLLDVEEQRTRNRVGAVSNGGASRNDAANGGNLQLVGIVFIEEQAEHADRVLVGSEASQRFRIIAVDVDSLAVLANCNALLLGILLVNTSLDVKVESASGLAASEQQLLFENFAGAVLFAGDEGLQRLVLEGLVDLAPVGVRVGGELAINGNFSSQSEIDVSRLEGEILRGLVGQRNTMPS